MDNQTDASNARQARIDRLISLRDQCIEIEMEMAIDRMDKLEPAIIAKLEAQLDAQGQALLHGLISHYELVAMVAIAHGVRLEAVVDKQKTHIKEMEVAMGRLEGACHEFEHEVRYWRFFFQESRRLFGDKKGPYGEMLVKARDMLKYDCWEHAILIDYPESAKHLEEMNRQFPEEVALAKNYHDKRLKNRWRKNRWWNIEDIVLRYGQLTCLPTKRVPTKEDLAYRERGLGTYLAKEDAIAVIAKEFGFQSPGAAFQELKRAGVKSLPDTWAESP